MDVDISLLIMLAAILCYAMIVLVNQTGLGLLFDYEKNTHYHTIC